MKFADMPETFEQARYWTKVYNHAVDYGLCPKCAAQLAWGHQIGFRRVEHRPCETCLPLVVRLSSERANGWRTVAGDAGSGARWRAER